MAKVIICFILTIVFSFLSVHSFMSNDYGPLKQWMLYYQEYKALQGALDKGNAGKAELLAKLKAMYPERAQEIENRFKAKYGDLKDEAEEKKSTLSDTLQDVTSSARNEASARSEAAAARKSTSRQETTRSSSSSSTTNNTSRSTTRTTDNRRDTQTQPNR